MGYGTSINLDNSLAGISNESESLFIYCLFRSVSFEVYSVGVITVVLLFSLLFIV